MVQINRTAKFQIGQVVRHRLFPFRGVIFDVDPTFNNTEEWWLSIPEEVRPRKDQPYYHLFAENAEMTYEAYVSEQNLLEDDSGEPVRQRETGALISIADPMRKVRIGVVTIVFMALLSLGSVQAALNVNAPPGEA